MRNEEQFFNPTAGEIDVLAILWEAAEQGEQALKLSEIRERINERRRRLGEDETALTTVSTYLRNAVAKRLLTEVRKSGVRIRSRGALSAARSPQTAYMTELRPGRIFEQTFRAIIDAYPPKERLHALLDFGYALDLPEKSLAELKKWLDENPTHGERSAE